MSISTTSSTVAHIDILRTLAHGSISGTYAAVGTPFAYNARIICITNNTDGDMLFSIDGVNDNLFVAATSFKLFDISTNRMNLPNVYSFGIGLQFFVKQSTAPSKNSVYIEVIY